MDLKLTLAILIGKTALLLIRLIGISGATSAPGLCALKIDSNLIKKISKNISRGSVLISGTNGKTTTSRLTADILSTKFKIMHNRQGSNLLRGIASTMIAESSFTGKVKSNLAIWEVDEATVSDAIKNLQPKIIILLNLFRDQLDRYGEVDSIRYKWQKSLSAFSKKGLLILNADDPGISFLANFHRGKSIYFGINDKKPNLPKTAQVADIKHCLRCNANLRYFAVLTSHMGHYQCLKCRLKRPKPEISAESLKFRNDFSSETKLSVKAKTAKIKYNLPGLYNVYNVLAATAISNSLGIDLPKIITKIAKFSAAFGRFQKIEINKKTIFIFLIKNPAGANEVLRTISQNRDLNVLVILNDKIADGQDVSWIWDTNWEILAPKTKKIAVSGLRADDLALRLKYAGFKLSKNNIYKEVNYSINACLSNLRTKDTLLILPTYTALLQAQTTLNQMGAAVKWHEH